MVSSSDIATPRASIHDDGTVEGYASLFGAVGQANDLVMPPAFAQTLRQRDIRRIPMLFQHDPAEPIGIWLSLEEDWLGLRVCCAPRSPPSRTCCSTPPSASAAACRTSTRSSS